MASRYRRSRSMGPFRLTATKSGLGISMGGPLGRVSVNTRGQVRETTRVPGIGLYQTRQVAQLGNPRPTAPAGTARLATHPTPAATPSASHRTGYQMSPIRGLLYVVLGWLLVIPLSAMFGQSKGWDWFIWIGVVYTALMSIYLIAAVVERVSRPKIALPTTPPAPLTPVPPQVLSGSALEAHVASVISAPTGTPPSQSIAVTALDATGGQLDLDPAAPDVVVARLVSLVDPVAKVADLVGLQPGADGMRHGVHEGLLMPVGSEWHAFILIHPEDNPALSTDPNDRAVMSLHVGRLGIRDVRKYTALFRSHPVHVALYLETTPGVERVEVRFLNREPHGGEAADAPTPGGASPPAATTGVDAVEHDQHKGPDSPAVAQAAAPVTAAPRAPLPPAGWYTDPVVFTQLRWWDGARWTTYTAPSQG